MFERRPFLLRYDSLAHMDTDLAWKSYKWRENNSNKNHNNYLAQLVGKDTELQFEVDWTYYETHTHANVPMFGPSFDPQSGGPLTHTTLPFHTFMDWYQRNAIMHPEDPLFYLNVQQEDKESNKEHQGGVYPPLSNLLDSGDIQLPYLLHQMGEALHWHSANVWMGRSSPVYGTQSKMHCDPYDNLYHVLEGRKRIILIGPSNAPFLATYGKVTRVDAVSGEVLFSHDGGEHPHFSHIDPWRNDSVLLEKYAQYQHVDGSYVLDVGPGDVVYIPMGWFHAVHSYGRSMAVNFWFVHAKFHSRLAERSKIARLNAEQPQP